MFYKHLLKKCNYKALRRWWGSEDKNEQSLSCAYSFCNNIIQKQTSEVPRSSIRDTQRHCCSEEEEFFSSWEVTGGKLHRGRTI